MDDKKIDKDSNVTNDDKLIQPKKCAPINHFFLTCKNTEEWEENNNNHSMLVENDENEREEED